MTYKVSFATLVTKLRASSIWLVSEMGGANLFLLLLLIGITFFPLFFVGFTTNDDATIAINFGENFDLLHESIITAQMQGRFMFLWAYPLLRLPYLIDNQAWYLFLKFGAIFLVLASLYFSIRQIFRSTWLAFTSVL